MLKMTYRDQVHEESFDPEEKEKLLQQDVHFDMTFEDELLQETIKL